jgi:hypothetical protein
MVTRLAYSTVLLLSALLGVHARAITAGEIDVNNTYENVGATLITLRAGNPLGLPEGTLIGNCTGTLIHPRVVLVAGHCVAPGVAFPGIPAWPRSIRPVVSFSHDNPRDRSTWIDVEVMYIHPSFPCREAPLTCCSGAPNQPCPVDADGQQVPALTPFFDIGVMVLTTPVTDLKLAKLANDGFLQKNVTQGARMTVVGYGEAQPNPDGVPLPLDQWDGLRRYGTSTMRDVSNAEWVRFNRDPSGTCFGDSGGPTFFLNRIVAVTSDGGPTCDTVDNRARVDAQAVLDWVEGLIASLGPLNPPMQ